MEIDGSLHTQEHEEHQQRGEDHQLCGGLTPIAARYTDARHDNFDIYLPAWLARHNKTIFGALYGGGILFTLALWLVPAGAWR